MMLEAAHEEALLDADAADDDLPAAPIDAHVRIRYGDSGGEQHRPVLQHLISNERYVLPADHLYDLLIDGEELMVMATDASFSMRVRDCFKINVD